MTNPEYRKTIIETRILGIISTPTPVEESKIIYAMALEKAEMTTYAEIHSIQLDRIALFRPNMTFSEFLNIISLLNSENLSELILSDLNAIPEFKQNEENAKSPYKGLDFLLRLRIRGVKIHFVHPTGRTDQLLKLADYLTQSDCIKLMKPFDAARFKAYDTLAHTAYTLGVDKIRSKPKKGRPPYGYRWDRKTMELSVVPEEAEIIQMMYVLRDKGFTYKGILAELAKTGHTTSKGTPFNDPQLARIFKREKFYKGVDEEGVFENYEPIL